MGNDSLEILPFIPATKTKNMLPMSRLTRPDDPSVGCKVGLMEWATIKLQSGPPPHKATTTRKVYVRL